MGHIKNFMTANEYKLMLKCVEEGVTMVTVEHSSTLKHHPKAISRML